MLGEIFSTGAIRIQFIHLRFGISLFLYTSVIDSCSFSATAVVKRVVQHLATPRGGFFSILSVSHIYYSTFLSFLDSIQYSGK